MKHGLGLEKVLEFLNMLEEAQHLQCQQALVNVQGQLAEAQAAVTEAQEGKAEAEAKAGELESQAEVLNNQLAMVSAQGGEEMEQAKAAMPPQKEAKTAELAAMHIALKQLTNNRLTSMFHRLDRSATGTISKEVSSLLFGLNDHCCFSVYLELSVVCCAQALLRSYIGDARKFFGALDTNGDGLVSLGEWDTLFAKMQQGLGSEIVNDFVQKLEEAEIEENKRSLNQQNNELTELQASLTVLQQAQAEHSSTAAIDQITQLQFELALLKKKLEQAQFEIELLKKKLTEAQSAHSGGTQISDNTAIKQLGDLRRDSMELMLHRIRMMFHRLDRSATGTISKEVQNRCSSQAVV